MEKIIVWETSKEYKHPTLWLEDGNHIKKLGQFISMDEAKIFLQYLDECGLKKITEWGNTNAK